MFQFEHFKILFNEKYDDVFLVENFISSSILVTELKLNQHFSILKILKIYLRKKLKMVFRYKTLSLR